MKKYTLLSISLGFIILASCDAPTEETRHEEEFTTPAMEKEIILEDRYSTWLTYEGTVPCADCSGKHLQLKLENSPDKKERAYELTETYLDTKDGDRKYTTKGIYQVHYGTEDEPSLMVIRLIDEDQQLFISFSQEANGSLQLLSQEEKKMVPTSNHTLKPVP
ncbi:copper resistance protein NlpE N-terminal domain-containing protein [Negadavirga shengliensis]|uniref:Copper resistance protein NlpE N-terminal domain-containing protein n=1 Tax=Negadavirga shengliensis TaxID=1389218 RepID=A0ABV9T4M8_9BACT